MRLRFMLTATLLAAAAIAAAGAAAVYMQRRAPEVRHQVIAMALGPTRLRLDSAYARNPDPARSETRLDLVASFPEFLPLGDQAAIPGRADQARSLFLSLAPQDQAADPADRTALIYSRFLEAETWSNPGGLVMRRFEPKSPYEGEELYFAPPEGRLFAARCSRPRQPPDNVADTCLAEFRLHGLDVRLRFDPVLLPEWEKLADGTRGLIEAFTR